MTPATNPWKLKATNSSRGALDKDEVRRALAIFGDPEHFQELRGLPSGRSRVRKGDDLDGLVRAAEELSDDRGVYWCINPVNEHLTGRAAANDDVVCLRWLLIDADPVKAEPDASATDTEKECARLLAEKTFDHLNDQGWPAPVLVDSGNGWQLLYRIEMDKTAQSRSLIKTLLHRLTETVQVEGAVLDKGVSRAAQLAKLPGTWARKGPLSDDRPHRQARLVRVPLEILPVSLGLIQEAAGVAAEPPSTPEPPPIKANPRPFLLRAYEDRAGAYVRAALDSEETRVRIALPGPTEGRNNALNKAGFNMGRYVGGGWILRQEVEQRLILAARLAGLEEKEILPTLKSGVEAGIENPKDPPESVIGRKPASKQTNPDEVIIVRAREITPRKVEWLWPGRIPLGKLTTFAGQGGLGKTFVLCDITARISQGLEWPDLHGECAACGQVLFVTGEDDYDDTIVPRLIESGANLDRVVFFKTEIQDRFTLADLPLLEKAQEQMGAGLKFIAIDPPTAFLGGVDDHKNAELRGLLSPLKSWANAKRVAIVFNTHVNKPQGAKVEAMMRVMGSVAWVNAVRAAHMFAKDPEDPLRRLFVPMKLNITKERKGLAYRILTTTDDLAQVEWLGEVETTADEAVNREASRPRRVIASDWVIERFREKREWSSDDLFRAAREEGISRSAMFEAKDRLHLPKARRVILPNGSTTWVWWVPDDWELLGEGEPATEALQDPNGADETKF